MHLNYNGPSSLSQNVSLVIGQRYMLSFMMNTNKACSPSAKSITGFVKLAGANVLNYTYASPSSGSTWMPVTYSFTASQVSNVITIGSSTSGTCGLVIDSVSIVPYSCVDGSNNNKRYLYYGIITNPGDCDTICGGYPQNLQNIQAAASHEFAEAITDPVVLTVESLNNPTYPIAWSDPVHSEIADLWDCVNDLNGTTVVGANGVSFTVQKLWSGVDNACVAYK